MNMEIGNVPPGEELMIEISVMQELELTQNTFYRLYVPSRIVPRYVMKRFANLEGKKEEKKSSWGEFTWSFKVNLKTGRKVIFHDSPTHKMETLNQNEEKT